jgi:hypothetical protein
MVRTNWLPWWVVKFLGWLPGSTYSEVKVSYHLVYKDDGWYDQETGEEISPERLFLIFHDYGVNENGEIYHRLTGKKVGELPSDWKGRDGQEEAPEV